MKRFFGVFVVTFFCILSLFSMEKGADGLATHISSLGISASSNSSSSGSSSLSDSSSSSSNSSNDSNAVIINCLGLPIKSDDGSFISFFKNCLREDKELLNKVVLEHQINGKDFCATIKGIYRLSNAWDFDVNMVYIGVLQIRMQDYINIVYQDVLEKNEYKKPMLVLLDILGCCRVLHERYPFVFRKFKEIVNFLKAIPIEKLKQQSFMQYLENSSLSVGLQEKNLLLEKNEKESNAIIKMLPEYAQIRATNMKVLTECLEQLNLY